MRLGIASVLVLSIASFLAGCTQPIANSKARTPVSHVDSRGDLRGEYQVIGLAPIAPTSEKSAF